MRARRALAPLVVVVALSVGAVAVATAPDSTRIAEPFDVTGKVGETVETRLLDVEVAQVRAAPRIVLSYGSLFGTTTPSYSSDGVWVVIDLTATTSTESLVISGTTLTIGEFEYSPMPLPSPAIDAFTVGSDVPVTGQLVFEVPTAVFESTAARTARLAVAPPFTARLDEVAVVELSLRDTQQSSSVTIDPAFVRGGEQ